MLNLNLIAKVTFLSEEGLQGSDILQALSYEYGQEEIEEVLLYYYHFTENRQARLVVAGGREFKDQELFDITLNHFMRYFSSVNIPVIIVSGGARGADTMAEDYARRYNLPFKLFEADWDFHGKAAGYVRNKEMAKYGTHLVAFHDGISKGTTHMINLAKEYELKVKVVKYGM